jgi:hypothetical protein
MRVEEHVHEEPIHGVVIHRDLFVALRFGDRRPTQLQPIERALARERRRRRRETVRPREHGEERIVAQRLVVVQIFVAQRQAVDALPHKRRDRMTDPRRIAIIAEACGELLQDACRALHFAQQHRAAVRGQRPPVEPRHHLAPPSLLKPQRVVRTLCRHNGRLRVRF